MSTAMTPQKRLKLSNGLTLVAIFLLIFTYAGGPLFEYHDPVTNELWIEEDNLSFQPLTMFIPDDTEWRAPEAAIRPYVGDKLYEFYPTGLRALISGYQTIPIWSVSLEAPQYPKASYPDGLPVFFTMSHFEGKVVEMDVINHYIGMDPMLAGAYLIRQLVPIIYAIFIAMLIASFFYRKQGWWTLTLIPGCFPIYFVIIFAYYLYWFGHNLHSYGAFTLKPFMPTVLGDGKVAQFTTHSYPTTGFYVLVLMFILLLLATLIKRRALNEWED